MGVGTRIRLRLFLEGVEVPVVAATIQVVPNAPSVCSLQIPPLPDGMRFLPRTIVHLFFYDYETANTPFPVAAGAVNTATNQSPTSYQNQTTGSTSTPSTGTNSVGDSPDIQNANYKLCFGGEVVGYQWTKNQAQRSLVLQCQDWSSYWDSAQQWNNTDLFGPGIKALFSGGSTSLFTDFLEDEGSAILRILQSPSIQYPNLQGLLGGIVHLLESIGGSYSYGQTIAGDNVFFSLAELRLHITQMITAYEQDPTASRLLSAGYDSLLGRTLGGLGQQVTMRQAINALMGIIFHETYAQPCPFYQPGSGNTPSGTTRTSVRAMDASFIATNADSNIAAINDLQTTLASNVSGTGSASTTQQLISSLTTLKQSCDRTANLITQQTTQQVQSAKTFYTSASRSVAQALSAARNWYPGASAAITNAVSNPLSTALTQMQSAAAFQITNTGGSTTTPARLCQQIFRPDVWFSSPPRCNVFFPEHYDTLTYGQNFLQEPTRLLLKTNDEFFGEDELFDEFYYAPKGYTVPTGTVQTGSNELQSLLQNGILDHELFTGIIPVFEKMGELNIFGARSGTKTLGVAEHIGLAQRSTNFLYFKYRFAARQLQISGKFNPYLACGFPALVVDKYVSQEVIKTRNQLIAQNGGVSTSQIDQQLGAHFLCNLTEVTHAVSQSSGSTTCTGTYARQFNEGSEFLGVVRPTNQVMAVSSEPASRVTVIAAYSAPQVGTYGPNGGTITAVSDVTQSYKGQSLPVYQGPPVAGSTVASLNVTIGVSQAASAYGANVASYIGNPAELVQFNAYRVTESVARYTQQSVQLPLEEYLRPGWYGDVWHPSLIGQAYQAFFGTGSITDQQLVQSANGSTTSTGVAQAAAQAALATASQATSAADQKAAAAGLLALDQQASIEQAVAFLVQLYSTVKTSPNADVDQFISGYTWRPIATMIDIFGTSDLAYDPTGQTVTSGIEGFHSRAFGPYNNLFGLVTPAISNVVGIQRGTPAAQRADTRLRKQQAVQQYVSAIQSQRAILG
jgi:hypothetical protein